MESSIRCLGRSFAVTNMKALLSVLLRRYMFELPGGPETKIGMKPTIVYRPTAEGQENFAMPVLVRKID
jgi:cytochrome P450